MSNLFHILRKLIHLPHQIQQLTRIINQVALTQQKQSILLGSMFEQIQELRLTNFQEADFQVFSQSGDDGKIAALTRLLPNIHPSFVEFGVENYQESNTRYLLCSKNWSGWVIDGDRNNIKVIKSSSEYWKHDLTAIERFITAENINGLLEEAKVPKNLGLLSIDIDGNDYWIWKAINCVKPSIVVVEYNSILSDDCKVTIPYDPKFSRFQSHYSGIYFGASLPAMISLGEAKGYHYLGTNLFGNNAYFVHHDCFSEKLISLQGTCVNYAAKFREARNQDGELSFISRQEAKELIAHLPLYSL